MNDWFQQHEAMLKQAIDAVFNRAYFSAYPEAPSPKIYGETADADGRAAFEALLGKPFTQLKQASAKQVGEEVSPYTLAPLGISYPAFTASELLEKASAAQTTWAKVDIETRFGILLESLSRLSKRWFEVAYATMHTTGQGYMMAFQASGPHAADRALEALALAYVELTRFPSHTVWDKPMGKFNIVLEKSWKPMPKGTNLLIGCSTFPTWNSVSGLYATLAAGNVAIMKPHPKSVLPIAIFIAELQQVLAEAGLDPHICQLAVDTEAAPLALELAKDSSVKLIDYTGGPVFGQQIEAIANKVTFTEKAGVNPVVLESADDIDAVVQNLAFSLALYSGQMCTAPQDFFVPKQGIKLADGSTVTAQAFAEKLSAAITALVENPKAGPFVLGAIQNPATIDRTLKMQEHTKNLVLKASTYVHPQFEKARTLTPAIAVVSESDANLFSEECFGPLAFVVETETAETGLALACKLVAEKGAISCGVYSTDTAFMQTAEDSLTAVGAPVSFNLTGGIYLNQHAAFSDFHVTGGNPAGNASFANPEFVVKRFTWVGTRKPAVQTAV